MTVLVLITPTHARTHLLIHSFTYTHTQWLVQQEMLDFMDCDSDGRSSIAYAAQGGQVLTIEWLVNKGASITEVTEAKCSTLMQLAAEHGQLEVVEWLYDEGLKISATDAYGRTALHYAAGSGYLDIVQWLHMKGSNVHTKDETGQTPMYRAIQGKQCLLRVTVVGESSRDWCYYMYGCTFDAPRR